MRFELDRAKILDHQFIECLQKGELPPARSALGVTASLEQKVFIALFECMMMARHIDFAARKLKEKNLGFYTIGSAGHEANAAIAAQFKPTDMAFLHYRSSAFMLARSQQVPQVDGITDQLLSLVAAKADPISQGRHKVFGRLSLSVPPQTSTIASHLPKVLGTAFALSVSKGLKNVRPVLKLPTDSVIIGSFGDASFNHSTLQGTLNAINWITRKAMPLPLLLICEDNGLGISVPTPDDWIESMMQFRPGWHYLPANGLDLNHVYKQAGHAAILARKGQPVFLHMKTVRLLGHAGSDIEQHYRTIAQIEESEANDPLLHTARQAIEHYDMSASAVLKMYEDARHTVESKMQSVMPLPRLSSAKEVMSSIIPPKLPNPIEHQVTNKQRQETFGLCYEQLTQPKNMAQLINFALTDGLLMYPQAVLFGEDVGKKGGVYRVTADLQARFGVGRVFDTLLDEQTILGAAMGMGHHGLLPIPEIQFLAYTHNAIDQLRGEAATLPFFSSGQFTNPMLIRIPGLGYLKGFGGHFHNDNAFGFLREIPGILIACPSSPRDAALMLKTCFKEVYLNQRIVVFLEPIALYHQKDLYEKGDNEFLEVYPTQEQTLPWGTLGITGESESLAIVSYANGHALSKKVLKTLKATHHIDAKLIDLRWLHPLNAEEIIAAIKPCTKVLIVDEGRRTGSISEALMTLFVENNFTGQMVRLTGEDTFIPIGQAWEYVLPSYDTILNQALALCNIRLSA